MEKTNNLFGPFFIVIIHTKSFKTQLVSTCKGYVHQTAETSLPKVTQLVMYDDSDECTTQVYVLQK